MSSSPDQRKRRDLRELLEALFADGPALFVDFIKEDVVFGDVIARNLPSLHAGWTVYVSAAVDGLVAQNVIDGNFFVALAARRPCQILPILRCAAVFELPAPALEGIVDGVEARLTAMPILISEALLLVKDRYPPPGSEPDDPRRRLTLRIHRLHSAVAVGPRPTIPSPSKADRLTPGPPPGASAHHDDIARSIEFNQVERAKRQLLSFVRNRLGIVAAVAVVSDLRKRGCAEWPEYILAKSASTLVAPEPPRARPLPLTCSGIRKRYRESRADFQLECAHLAIPPRTVLGLVGANGTGKSTLLRILAGRSTADAGEIHYPHRSGAVSWLRGDVDWRAIRDRIFYVEQDRELLFGRLDQELHLFAQTQGYRGDMNRCIVDLVLEQTELASYRKMRWSQLSGGYRLRAVLAKLLISRATLVVLDEPLAPLDVDAQRDVLDYLKESTVYADEPRCTILSSQHIPEIESIADQMMMTDPSGLVQPIDVSQGACVEIGAAPEALSGSFIESVRKLGEVRWVDARRSCIVVESASLTPVELTREAIARVGSHAIHLQSFRDISKSALRRFKERHFYA